MLTPPPKLWPQTTPVGESLSLFESPLLGDSQGIVGVSTVSFDPTRALSTAFQVIRSAAWATPAYK